MRSFFTIQIFLFTITVLNAQKSFEPTSQTIGEAKELKKQFHDSDIVIAESYVQVSFGYKNRNVTVNKTKNERLINIDSRSDIRYYEFYDGMSEIDKFSVKNRNNKKAYFYEKDEAYTSSDLFHNDTRVKYVEVDFPLFAYEYNFTVDKTFKDIKYFTTIYFNDQYPIKKKIITIEIPDWLDVEFKELNFDNHNITKSVKKDEKNSLTTYTYNIKDLSPQDKDENAPGPSYIFPHLLVLPKKHFKENTESVIFETTKNQYNWYKELTSSLESNKSIYKSKVLELTKDAKSDEEKIKNIYYWIQDNIRYIAFEDGIAGFKPDEAHNVFTKRYGDCKGMANLTKEMLIEAGFDARLTWIGTKHIAYDYSTPNLAVDNHMICTLNLNDESIYLDATEKYNSFGEYAERIQGKQVLIENGDDYILKYIPEASADKNIEITKYDVSISDENLNVKVSKHFKGETRAEMLNYLNQVKTNHKDDFLNYYLSEGESNTEVSNIQTSNLDDRDIDIIMDYDAIYKGKATSFDNDIYVDIDFDKELSGFLFDKRKTDYVFRYKKSIQSKTILEIPEGYKVSELPNNYSVDTDNYKFSIEFKIDNNKIIYDKFFSIKKSTISKNDFEAWNTAVKSLNEIYSQQITLSK